MTNQNPMKDVFHRGPDDLFPPADRAKIEALTEDPNAQVSYELTKGMLLWSDEIPRDIEDVETLKKRYMLASYRSIMIRSPGAGETTGSRPRSSGAARVASGRRAALRRSPIVLPMTAPNTGR